VKRSLAALLVCLVALLGLVPAARAHAILLHASPAPKETVSGPADTLSARGQGFAPGEYRLKWQVLSADGHITRGEHPFTVK